jgi:UvrD/REP helicase N-terminal domain
VRVPTAEQQDILAAAAAGHDLVKVSAGAGTGKTSTTEWLARVPYRRSGGQLYSQFAIAGGEDAARRLAGSGARVLRPGQLAWRAAAPWMKDRLNEHRITSADAAQMIHLTRNGQVIGPLTDKWVQDNTMFFTTAAAWVSSMRETVKRFCHSANDVVLKEHVDPRVRDADAAAMARAAQWLWDEHLNRPEGTAVSYTMDHCKKHWSLRCPRYHYGRIMLDEAQDTNPCDLHVFKNQDTQLIVIGDTQQQLYEWRGSVDSLDDKALPGGIWLPLTGSFRFGPEIAGQANRFLALLGAAYRLTGLGQPGYVGALDGQASAVLCRTNAECMKVAVDCLKQGKTVALAGRTRDELLGLARGAMALRNGRRTEHPALVNFRTWKDFREYAENDLDGRDFLSMVRLIEAYGERLEAMLRSMTDGPADVTCATVWKAKGLEWPAVRVADDFWPGEGGDLNQGLADWWLSGERREPFLRVCYVAVTRAQVALDCRNLAWISESS